MKTYQIRVTQDLTGYYEGFLEVEAKNKVEAKKIIKNMKLEDIDNEVDWDHGDQYDGDYTTIVFQDELEEVDDEDDECLRCKGEMRIVDYENGDLYSEDGKMPCPECQGA